jgi:hypothetical protein
VNNIFVHRGVGKTWVLAAKQMSQWFVATYGQNLKFF